MNNLISFFINRKPFPVLHLRNASQALLFFISLPVPILHSAFAPHSPFCILHSFYGKYRFKNPKPPAPNTPTGVVRFILVPSPS